MGMQWAEPCRGIGNPQPIPSRELRCDPITTVSHLPLSVHSLHLVGQKLAQRDRRFSIFSSFFLSLSHTRESSSGNCKRLPRLVQNQLEPGLQFTDFGPGLAWLSLIWLGLTLRLNGLDY